MRDFASHDKPLRCSALPLLVACPWRAVMLHLGVVTDTSGKAADTGSAVHKAAEAWHKGGQDFDRAVKAMRAALREYPLADLDEALLHFRPYAQDPRNQNAQIVLIEEAVAFTLPPAEDDPTASEIYVMGRLDQVRMEPDGGLALYDIKTGKSSEGFDMLAEHAIQIAAYCHGASKRLKKPVRPGALIRTYDYRKRTPGPAFWEFAWGWEGVETLLRSVRRTVAAIRRGDYSPVPGRYCSYCPAGGLTNCESLLRRHK